jgi:hypothetical protein
METPRLRTKGCHMTLQALKVAPLRAEMAETMYTSPVFSGFSEEVMPSTPHGILFYAFKRFKEA